MATLDDLSQGIVTTLAGYLFPGQTYLEGSVANAVAPWDGVPGSSALTIPARLYRGSPEIADLNADIANGIADISVTNLKRMSRNTTRFQPYYTATPTAAATLTASFTPNSVTFAGTCGSGQAVGLYLDGVVYAYRTTGADNPGSVAAALAAKVGYGTASGATFTVPDNSEITNAVVVVDQAGLLHTGTQEQMVQIAIMAPNIEGVSGYLVRAALMRLIDGLKSIQRSVGSVTRFITLSDTSSARVLFHDDEQDDTPRNNNIWRQWSRYRCEFDSTVTVLLPVVLTVGVLVRTGAGQVIWAGDELPLASVFTDSSGDILTDATGSPLGSLT